MYLPEDKRMPRDRDSLVREVDALIRISDIQTIHRYRDQMENKWWEPAIVALLFISGLGFVLTIYKLIPAQEPLLFWFVFGWFALFVLTLIASIEFLLLKISALRRLHEVHTRVIDQLLKERKEAADPAGETPVNSSGEDPA